MVGLPTRLNSGPSPQNLPPRRPDMGVKPGPPPPVKAPMGNKSTRKEVMGYRGTPTSPPPPDPSPMVGVTCPKCKEKSEERLRNVGEAECSWCSDLYRKSIKLRKDK